MDLLYFQSKKCAVALFIGLLLAACATMGPQDTDQFIFLDESDTLYVVFRHSVNPAYEVNMPEIAESMKDLRRDDFMHVMEELLYAAQLPVDVHLLAEREKPGDGPVLEIFSPRFELDSSGHLVATINAKLSKYGELNTLGTYSERDVPPIGFNNQQMEKAYRDVLRKPLQEMINDLLAHFETPEEKEMLNAPF